MSDRQLTLLIVTLTALAGLALYRFIGPTAGGATGAALISLFRAYRARRRALRRELVARVRAEDPAQRVDLLREITDADIRRGVEVDVDREGTITREGNVERFPFPDSFIRFATSVYWIRWLLTAALLGVAAFSSLSPNWRVVIFVFGLAAIFSVWRATRFERALQTVIVISPSAIAEVWPDDTRRIVYFVQRVTIDVDRDGESLWIASPSTGQSLYLSRHRLAYRRLARLCQQYARVQLSHHETAT